eukprot:508750-Rhodomonas_salina.1
MEEFDELHVSPPRLAPGEAAVLLRPTGATCSLRTHEREKNIKVRNVARRALALENGWSVSQPSASTPCERLKKMP